MIFVVNGRLVLIREDRNIDVEELSDGAWLGAVHLFISEIRDYTVCAITHTELLEITQESFRSILVDFPSMQDQYSTYQGLILAGKSELVEHPPLQASEAKVDDEGAFEWLRRKGADLW